MNRLTMNGEAMRFGIKRTISGEELNLMKINVKQITNVDMNKEIMREFVDKIKELKNFKITVYTREYNTRFGTDIVKDIFIEDLEVENE